MRPEVPVRVRGLRVTAARSFWARFRGLLGRRAMDPDEALFLVPCTNIHTFWMRFAIDVAFLDRGGQVVAIVPRLGPWRVAAARRAYACLELSAGTADRIGLQVGQTMHELAEGHGPLR